MPTLTELIVRISGDPRPFVTATNQARAEYLRLGHTMAAANRMAARDVRQTRAQVHALERDLQIASARMSGNLLGLGRSMTMDVTVPLLGIGAAAGKLAIDFERELSKITGLVGIAKSQVNSWRDDILSLAGETGKAPQELAEALYFITSSGIKGSQALDVLKMSAKASAAGLGETQQIADALTSVLNAYKGTALTAASATDILVATVREGKAEADKIAGSIGHVAAIASEMGVSFNDVGAAIAGLTRVGLDSAESVTALKRVLATLLDPTKEADKVLHHYKLTAAELRKEAQDNLIGALLHVKEAMGANVEDVSKVFGSMKGLTGMLSLTGKQTDEVVATFEALRNSTGMLDEAFKEATTTTDVQLRQALAELQAAGIDLGDALVPTFKEIAKEIREAAKWFRSLSDEQKQSVIHWAKMIAILGPSIYMFGQLARTIKVVYDAFVMMRTAQLLANVAMGGTVVQATAASGAIGTLTTIGPAILAVGALAAVVWGLSAAWDNWSGKSAKELNEEMSRSIETSKTSALATYDNAVKIKELAKEYEKLTGKAKLTKDEKLRLREVLEEISKLQPTMIDGYDKHGNALKLVADYYAEAAKKAREAAEAFRIANAQAESFKLGQIADKRAKLQASVDERKAMVKPMVPSVFEDEDGRITGRMFPHPTDFRDKTKYSADVFVPETDPFIKKFDTQFEKDLKADEARIAELTREHEASQKRMKAALKGDITSSGTNRTGGTGGSKPGGGNNGYNIGPGADLSGDDEAKRKRDKALEDGKRLIEDFNKSMGEMERLIALNGDTTEYAALEWELYSGALSRTALDGTRVSEWQKQNALALRKEVDDMIKLNTAIDLSKKTKADYTKQTAMLHAETELEKADVERLHGIYKTLPEWIWKQVRARIAQYSVEKTWVDLEKQSLEAAKEKSKAYRELAESMGTYLKQLMDANREARLGPDAAEVDKVLDMFEKGGKFEKMRDAKIPFTNESFMGKMLEEAATKDIDKRNEGYKEALKNLREQAEQVGLNTEYEKELWKIQAGKYGFLTKAQEDEILLLARRADHARAQEELEEEIKDRAKDRADSVEQHFQKIREQTLELVGLTREARLEMLMLNDELTMAEAEQVLAMQEKFDRFREGVELMKTLSEGVANVFDEVVSKIWEDGFKGLFTNIIQGFKKMLQEMATEYLKSLVYKAIFNLSVQALGGGGGKNDGWKYQDNTPFQEAAMGGQMHGLTMVGEHGPELIQAQGEHIMTSEDIYRALARSDRRQQVRPILESGRSSGPSSSPGSTSGGGLAMDALPPVNINVSGVSDLRDWEKNMSQVMGHAFYEMQRNAIRDGYRGSR